MRGLETRDSRRSEAIKSLRHLDAEFKEESEHDPTPDSEKDSRIWCPYCGGSGNEEWFETHEHLNPFGDDAA